MSYQLLTQLKLLPKSLLLLGLVSTGAQAQETVETLGETLYRDANLSSTRIVSCASCHSLDNPGFLGLGGNSPSFVDNFAMPINFPVSLGAKLILTPGTLNAPSAGYAAFSPPFHQDANGDYVGGQFWNGRASSLADQAEGPFLNPVEMALPSKWVFVSRLKERSYYVNAFRELYGIDLDTIPTNNSAKASDPAPALVDTVFRTAAEAIGEFEKTDLFNRFTSKYDFYLAGEASLSSSEQRGLDLFNGKAGCSGCHTSSMSDGANPLPPLFTNFKYYNIGVPRNYGILNKPTPDIGLAGNPQVIADGRAQAEFGKHKVMSLRNIAKTPPYMHNGIFTSLKQVVNFHNTRDTKWRVGNNLWPHMGDWFWPASEYTQNITREVGKLRLSNRDVDDLVNFLETLTDGYRHKKVSPWSANARPAIREVHSKVY